MSKYKELYKHIFGQDHQSESYKLVGHQWEFNKGVGKQVCKGCGLLALRNDFTDWSVRMGCLSYLHPSYESIRKRTSIFKEKYE